MPYNGESGFTITTDSEQYTFILNEPVNERSSLNLTRPVNDWGKEKVILESNKNGGFFTFYEPYFGGCVPIHEVEYGEVERNEVEREVEYDM